MQLHTSRNKRAGLIFISPASFASTWSAGQGLWLRPVGIAPLGELHPVMDTDAVLPLAGGPYGFTHLDLVTGEATAGYQATRVSIAEARRITNDETAAQLATITCPRPAFAGLPMDRVQVMGILNVTPDSFSDGGRFCDVEAAIAHGCGMAADGAALLDVGGESTRPGAEPVSTEDELARIIPVISGLAKKGHLVSADTRHSAVMGPALAAGARIINDVSGFTDVGAAEVMGHAYLSASTNNCAIAMHMQGTPQTMQDDPEYGFVPIEVFDVLACHIDRLVAAGLPQSNIAVDPGFGFGKGPAHNAEVISWTSLFHGLGVPVLLGVSRKSSIPKLAASGGYKGGYGELSDDRLGGSLALTLAATAQGAQIIRTHDVAETVQAVAVQKGLE
ncbi:MAG: dihydropteroate synthase [Rhodospirillaceae bacterium]|nr:dihydropteroate synthase [Rhodospirillaceae bacterium]